MSESASGEADSGRTSNGKKPPHECYGCDKEYTRPHKRLVHMRNCCPGELEPCPKCGEGYTNEKGVKFHHARKHGESIAKTDIYCERCGDFYKSVYDSNSESYTHCDACRDLVKSERMEGESNPQHGTGEVIEYECAHCGKHNERLASDYVTVYCDMDCRDAHQRGENHGNWKGGESYYYGPNWENQREACLERDNYRCQGCGISNEEATVGLNAHHIQPYRTFEKRESANQLDNLVALCLSCHGQWEGLPIKPKLV